MCLRCPNELVTDRMTVVQFYERFLCGASSRIHWQQVDSTRVVIAIACFTSIQENSGHALNFKPSANWIRHFPSECWHAGLSFRGLRLRRIRWASEKSNNYERNGTTGVDDVRQPRGNDSSITKFLGNGRLCDRCYRCSVQCQCRGYASDILKMYFVPETGSRWKGPPSLFFKKISSCVTLADVRPWLQHPRDLSSSSEY